VCGGDVCVEGMCVWKGGGGYACVTDFTQSQMTLHNFIVRLMCKLGPTNRKDLLQVGDACGGPSSAGNGAS